MNTLAEYYFSQPGLVLVPVEHLSKEGVSEEYRALFARYSTDDPAFLELLSAAVRLYWQRLTELHRLAPAHWFPPRIQHIALIAAPEQVRPYFQPIHQSTWLLYASDFDPKLANLEFACFQILQAERMGQMNQVVAATGANLSYWLLRSDEEIAQYREACATNPRPDIHGQRTLSKHLGWIRSLYHETLRPPSEALKQQQQLQLLPGTGLFLSRARFADMERLVHSCSRAAHENVANFFKAQGRGAGSAEARQQLDALCDGLRQTPPRMLISGQDGQLLWDFEQPAAVDGLRRLLKDCSPQVLKSLQADWQVIDQRSRQFIAALKNLDSLPQPQAHYADQNGLCYMHIRRRELTYNLQEAGMQRLLEITPPFERLMLGARAIHEWGHLFVDSGGVPVAPDALATHAARLQRCAALYEEILAAAPTTVQRIAATSLHELRQGDEGAGEALARLTLARMEDFQANLMAQRFLPAAEMETYVRNNHRSHVHDYPREAYFQRLARYVYEYQYLRFSAMADPESYFLKTTWFSEQYLHNQVLSWERAQALIRCVSEICDCYQVDEERFHGA